jgi:hypothetical protein
MRIRLESISTNEQELHIYLYFTRGYKFISRKDEQNSAYDTEEKQWQHLNFFQHKCYLHACIPRLKDAEGKVYRIEVPWARAGSGLCYYLKHTPCYLYIPNRERHTV